MKKKSKWSIHLDRDEGEDAYSLTLNKEVGGMSEDEEEKKVEVWAKVFFNGYFLTFDDMSVNVQIRVKDSESYSKVFIFPGIDEKDGEIDLTSLLHTYLKCMKENPGKEVTASLNGFRRRIDFNENLLSTPIPESLLNMFE